MRTIVKMLFGSHLYGTNTPSSDTDRMSVHIPDATDILLQSVKDEIIVGARQKSEGEKNTPCDVDNKSFSLQKFLNLAAEGQTVAIDMLFVPRYAVEESSVSAWWFYIVQNRLRLLSKKSAAFVGYCRQQANKYGIKGSRVAAAKETSEIFSGLASAFPAGKVGQFYYQIAGLVQAHPDHIQIVSGEIGSSGQMGSFFECCGHKVCFTAPHFECCGRKVCFTAPLKQAAELYGKIYENYGARARLAQENQGVDWKALSHAVRVGGEAVELLTTCNVTFPLPNAAHVLDIKLGRLPYQEVSEEIDNLLVDVEAAAASSPLPAEPDYEFIRNTVVDAYGNRVRIELPDMAVSRNHDICGSRPGVSR